MLKYLHSKGVTHRDIKLENIIIDNQKHGMIKLIDFGFCCCTQQGQKLKIFCGTPSYMCPEIVLKREYLGPPTDIWATGVLVFALLCGQFPFKGLTDKDLYKKITKGVITWPDHLSTEAKSFISRMLVVDPSKRSTSAQLLEDPWMRGSVVSGEFLSTQESSTAHPNYDQLRKFEEKLVQKHHFEKIFREHRF